VKPTRTVAGLIGLCMLDASCFSTHYARSSSGIEKVKHAELEWDAGNVLVTAVDGEKIDRGLWTMVGVLPACRVFMSPGPHEVRVKVRDREDAVTVSLEAGMCYTVDSWSGKYIGWLPILGIYSAPGSGGFVIVDDCNMTMSKSTGRVIAIGGRTE